MSEVAILFTFLKTSVVISLILCDPGTRAALQESARTRPGSCQESS